MPAIPALITPLDEHMGLDIARSLGRRGIPVYGIDSDLEAPGRYSRFCRFVTGPSPETRGGADFVEFLVEFGKRLGCKAVLYPLADRHVLLCSANRSILQNHYEFVMPGHDTIVRLTTKDGLQTIARDFKIAAPRTIFLGTSRRIEDIAREMTYPAILKPTESTYWHIPQIAEFLRQGPFSGRTKVILCRDSAELIQAYRRIASYDNRLVVQEVIPGEDSCLVYFAFYLDRQSRALGVFAGRKHRVLPVGFGSASFVRSFYDPALKDLALGLLSDMGYQGLGGIEFKKDLRDEAYKLVEFNTRFGMWDGLGVRCGVDLPYIAYCDAIHLPVQPQLTYRTGVIWVDLQRDVRAALAYWRAGKISFGQWLNSLRGKKMWAVYSKEDWRPGVALSLALGRKLWTRFKRKNRR